MTIPNDTAPESVVFNARGVEIDTRLKVFDTVFHVSSTILRMHSQYFFKFLDSADKVVGTGQGGFKYDWVTKIVDDGKEWQLVAAGPNTGELILSQWKGGNGKKFFQQNAFHNILKAMYMQPYVLVEVQDLLDMTSLARFYMCLPLVSRTLDGTMARSHKLSRSQLKHSCLELLSAATELRHKALFKDSLIYCLGPLSNPDFKNITDKKLKRVAQIQYHILRSKILEGLQTILYALILGGPSRDTLAAAVAAEDDWYCELVSVWFERGMILEKDRMNGGWELCLPRLFHEMVEDGRVDGWGALEKTTELMRNDLTVGLSESEAAGKGIYEDHFLFTTIEEDDEYPWDMTVDDW